MNCCETVLANALNVSAEWALNQKRQPSDIGILRAMPKGVSETWNTVVPNGGKQQW